MKYTLKARRESEVTLYQFSGTKGSNFRCFANSSSTLL